MSRRAWGVIIAITAIYVVLGAMGIAGIGSMIGGIVYRAIIIAILVFSCIRAFAAAHSNVKSESPSIRDTVLIGALGLAAVAVSVIFEFCYIYLLGGYASDITIGNFSRSSAYLFFIAAIITTVEHPTKKRWIGISAIPSISVIIILAAVVINNRMLMHIAALIMITVCTLLSVKLLMVGFRQAKVFACSILVISVLETVYRLLILFGEHPLPRDIVVSLYPAAYLFICFSLISVPQAGQKKAKDGVSNG